VPSETKAEKAAAPGKELRDSLIQYIALAVVSWLIMYLVPPDLLFTVYIPASFWVLSFCVVLIVLGGGWPLAPPAGRWKPGMSRAIPGIGMTVIYVVLVVIANLIALYVWPRLPLFPDWLYIGVTLFIVSVWYALDWGAWPFAGRVPAWANAIIGASIIYIITGIVYNVFVRLLGVPPGWWFGFIVWTFVWVQALGNVLTMQSYPYAKLGQPASGITITLLAVLLGYVCWNLGLTIGIEPTAWFAAIGAPLIGWTLVHPLSFKWWPFTKYKQCKRGILSFLFEILLTAIFAAICQVILMPIMGRVTAAGLAFPPNVNVLTALYFLHFIAPLFLLHTFFWLRAPLSPLSPPGTPPPEEGR